MIAVAEAEKAGMVEIAGRIVQEVVRVASSTRLTKSVRKARQTRIFILEKLFFPGIFAGMPRGLESILERVTSGIRRLSDETRQTRSRRPF